MKVRVNLSVIVSALIVMAAVSLLAIFGLTLLNHIVHGSLYDFGLRFSYRWAMPYWINSGIIIGLSWINITAAIGLTYYVFRGRKRASRVEVQKAEKAEVQAEESVRRPEGLIEMQILDKYCESAAPQIKSYDVKHPKDVVDSQC